MTTIGENTALVFGGLHLYSLLNDVWLLTVSVGGAEWALLPSLGDAPTVRRGHYMATLADNTVAVYGGLYGQSDLFNETWLLDVMFSPTSSSTAFLHVLISSFHHVLINTQFSKLRRQNSSDCNVLLVVAADVGIGGSLSVGPISGLRPIGVCSN